MSEFHVYYDDVDDANKYKRRNNKIIINENIYKIVIGSLKNDIGNIKFPESLHILHFGYNFNQNIDNVKFPDNLHTFNFGSEFDQNINNVKFPNSLHTLKFGQSFNQKLDDVKLPYDLHTLDLVYVTNEFLSKLILPIHIKEIIVHSDHKNIPKLPYGCVCS